MRIISGINRGRKLFTPPPDDKRIRPTSDKAREALFSILGNSIQGAKVLDLFAGTGAMGLEAFSRNADLVVFVDNAHLALQLIRKNIALCLSAYKGNSELKVINHDLTKGLPFPSFPTRAQAGFDLIFADPPYDTHDSISVLNSVNETAMLTKNGMIIVEERFNVILPNDLSRLRLIDKRIYGASGFWLYQRPSD